MVWALLAIARSASRNSGGVCIRSALVSSSSGLRFCDLAAALSSAVWNPSSNRTPEQSPQSILGNTGITAYSQVSFLALCPYRPWVTRQDLPPHRSVLEPQPQPNRLGVGRPNQWRAELPSGCSRTPPNVLTAHSAAAKQPLSSPRRRRSLELGPPYQYLPHRFQGGCATTGCGPRYPRASLSRSQTSTPGIPEYGPSRSTYSAETAIGALISRTSHTPLP